MRREMDNLEMDGRVVIGEGERDQAPMLYVGEPLGRNARPGGAVGVDIAVDPLEGTNLCATGARTPSPSSRRPRRAASPRSRHLHGEDRRRPTPAAPSTSTPRWPKNERTLPRDD